MRTILKSLFACLMLALVVPEAFGQQEIIEDRTKMGQTTMQFLTVPVDARAGAMADALTAQEGSSIALFYNPAGMARMNTAFHVSLGRNQWISETDYNVASASFRPAGGRYGTFGVSVLAVSYGELEETIRADNEQGFVDLGTFSPSALSVGFGYARALTDRFAVGGQVKYVQQDLGSSVLSNTGGAEQREDLVGQTVAFDFGILYQTGFESLNFAVSARNFSRELKYAEENTELPLNFRVGMSVNLIDFTSFNANTHSFLLAVDAEHPRDNVEQLRVGGEYMFLNTIALRAGYVFPSEEQGINLGLGLQQEFGGFGFGFDYGYTQFGIFGNVHRLAVQLAL